MVLTYDLLEDRCTYDVTINDFSLFMRWFSFNRSQKKSECDRNISDTLGSAKCATFQFLPPLDVICYTLLKRRSATFICYTNKLPGGKIFERRLVFLNSCFLKIPPHNLRTFEKREKTILLTNWVALTLLCSVVKHETSEKHET